MGKVEREVESARIAANTRAAKNCDDVEFLNDKNARDLCIRTQYHTTAMFKARLLGDDVLKVRKYKRWNDIFHDDAEQWVKLCKDSFGDKSYFALKLYDYQAPEQLERTINKCIQVNERIHTQMHDILYESSAAYAEFFTKSAYGMGDDGLRIDFSDLEP